MKLNHSRSPTFSARLISVASSELRPRQLSAEKTPLIGLSKDRMVGNPPWLERHVGHRTARASSSEELRSTLHVTDPDLEILRMLDRPVTLPSAGVGRELCCYRSHKRLPPIITESSLLTISSLVQNGPLCPQDASHPLGFLHVLPSAQAQCRAEVCENPNDLRQDHRKGSCEARRSGEVQTFWSLRPDCAGLSAGRQAIANTGREVRCRQTNSDMSHETISGDAWESTDW